MDPRDFKERLIDRLDSMLGRPLLVWGEDRRLLTAVRAYLDVMPESELARLAGFYHERTGDMDKATQAQALGIDLGKIDWTKVLQLVQFLIQLFGQPKPLVGAAGDVPAAPQDRKALLKAAGCPDHELDHCCACLDAACLALQSAQLSLTCCNDCCRE